MRAGTLVSNLLTIACAACRKSGLSANCLSIRPLSCGAVPLIAFSAACGGIKHGGIAEILRTTPRGGLAPALREQAGAARNASAVL